MSMESNKDPVEEEKFSFLQEKIKEEPLFSKKMLKWFLRMAILGIVFGIMACIGFYMIRPWAETIFEKHKSEITIPQDEENFRDNEENVDRQDQSALTVEDLNDSYKSLYSVVAQTQKSIVDVYGIHGNEGWIRETYDTVHSVSGVIIANTSTEVLILSNDSILEQSESIDISFCDGKKYPAHLKKCDKNIGMAVFGVEKRVIDSSTLSQINTAVLGNSNHVREGDILIALGKPFAFSGGIGYGVASTVKQNITIEDGEYSLLLTDIPGNEEGSGFLCNIKGEIVGIIKPNLTNNQYVHSTNALAISELKQIIELLSNSKSVPYIGITGAEVTKEIQEKEGIPAGIYIKGVEADSPAMEAGIQNGDVITHIENISVKTIMNYQRQLLKHEKGSIVKLSGLRRGNDGYVEINFKVTVGSKE